MKKETIKLTESRLRKLVEACVKEALAETLDEGATSDFIGDIMKADMSNEDMPTWEEFKQLVKGKPDKAQYLYNKLMYNQAKSGHIDNIGNKTATDYGSEAIITEPGFKGKAKRAAAGAAWAGKTAFDKAKKSFKKEKPEDDGSFTL
jgi:hypothetical protein